MKDVKEAKTEEVPTHLRDKHYFGAKKMGHGEGYLYPHGTSNDELPVVDQSYRANSKVYYHPSAVAGFEKVLAERLKKLKERRKLNPEP